MRCYLYNYFLQTNPSEIGNTVKFRCDQRDDPPSEQHQRHHSEHGRRVPAAHERVRAVPDARHSAALLREAPGQDTRVHGQGVGQNTAAG